MSFDWFLLSFDYSFGKNSTRIHFYRKLNKAEQTEPKQYTKQNKNTQPNNSF